MDTVDRNYVESLIEKARDQTTTAAAVALDFGLDDVAERLTWALEFLDAARLKLPASEREST